MPEPAHNDLRRAESLRREGKLQEALEVINKIEKKGDLTPGDRLSLLISKGKILTVYQRHAESIQVGELAYQLSQALGRVEDSIFALQFKANKLFLGEPNVALDYLLEAEKLLNSLTDVSPSFLSRQRANILYRRAWANSSKGDSDTALETALECLELRKKFGRKIDIAYIYELLSYIYNGKADNNVALDYALKSLEIFKELGNSIGQATLLAQAGFLSYITGDINNALMYCKKSLSTELIGDRTKLNNLLYIGLSYNMKGEIDRALRYYKRGSSLAEELNDYNYFILSQNLIGSIYLQKKNYDLAIDYLKPSLALAKNTNHAVGIIQSLTWLGMIYLDLDLSSELQEILDQLKELSEKGENSLFLTAYRMAKAMVLKKSRRSRDRAKAEKLFKKAIKEPVYPEIYYLAIFYLCEFYIEELSLFNEPELFKEINPLLEELLKFSKEQNSYSYLAQTQLLKAKLALIQMDVDTAKKLFTQAQRVAELHELNALARKISIEHDKLLDQIRSWEELKEREAPFAERLKLASVDGDLERLQGKRIIEAPELVEEEPIVLLIIDKSGISYFNHSFRKNWDFDWLFSSFMSAFDTFSSEVFSESIDRIKIGENLILINPLESFLVCYVIKGQSYPGLQKLNRFSNAIKENTEIWESLNRAVKTGEVLEIDNPQALGNVVNEIFISKLSALH